MDNKDIQYVLTINAPAGSVVKINGEIINKIEVTEDDKIEILVTKFGYIPYEQVLTNISQDTTINIDSLELIKHNIKIVTDEDNIVTINGFETNELTIDEFTSVNICVENDGYISQTLSFDKITQDEIINIQLEKIYHTFKIFIPEDASIIFNPELCAKRIDNYLLVTVDEFTPINWTISKPGYKDHSVFIEKVKKDKNFEAPILEYETFTLKVIAGKNCKGAILTLDDKIAVFGQSNEIGTIGSEVTVKVEKENYITYLQTVLITENTIITVDLEEKKYTLSIENIPENTVVTYKVNNSKPLIYEEPIEIKSGSKIIIKASKEDYKPFIYTIDSFDKDYAIRVPIMELQKYNLTVNAPEGSLIKINGTETKYFPQIFDIHSKIKVEVSKEKYITHIHEFEIIEDTVYDCVLNLEQCKLTVTSNPENANITIINGSEQYNEREIFVDYGSEVIIKGELEGFNSVEKKIQILQDTTENIVFEKKLVLLTVIGYPENVLSDALIKVDNVQIPDNKTYIIYGENHNVTVEKFGYKTYTENFTPFEDTIIYVNNGKEWHKPTLSVNIKNINEIKSVPVILINNIPVTNGVAIPINYYSTNTIEISADEYFTINDEILIKEDTTLEYELIDINSGKYLLLVKTDLEDAVIYINDKKQHTGYFEPETEIKVEIKHNGYKTITDEFVLTENTEKFYSYELFEKRIFKCQWYTNPSTAIVKINDEIIDEKYVDVPYLTNIEYSVLCENYLPKFDTITVTEDTKIKVVLNQDPNYKNENDEDIYGEGLDGIIRMIKLRSCYSYLYIGKYFTNGIDEDSVYEFYKKFGYYVNSKFDYLLWHKMHDYFGHVNNIPEPEPDNSHSLKSNNNDDEIEIIK